MRPAGPLPTRAPCVSCPRRFSLARAGAKTQRVGGVDARFEAQRGAPLRFQRERGPCWRAGAPPRRAAKVRGRQGQAESRRTGGATRDERKTAKREREAELARLRAEVARLPSIKDPQPSNEQRRRIAALRDGLRHLRNHAESKGGDIRRAQSRLDPVAEHRFDYHHAREVNRHGDAATGPSGGGGDECVLPELTIVRSSRCRHEPRFRLCCVATVPSVSSPPSCRLAG